VTVDSRRYLRLFAEESQRLAATAAPVLDAKVPTCPGWDVAELVRHTGSVYRRVVAVLELGHRPESWQRVPPRGQDLITWFEASRRAVFDTMTARTPGTPTWTWYGPWQQVAFWWRRMAYETVLHRVDAELAAGKRITPIDDAFAIDGVDEVLECFLRHRGTERGVRGTGESVLVEADENTWGVSFFPAGVEVTPGLVEPDVMVRGVASEVFLWLWGRLPDRAVVIDGADSVAERLRSDLVKVMQFPEA
jgi:uncharacterized protein (TIGR03083 family)